jgi:hypothetical protein
MFLDSDIRTLFRLKFSSFVSNRLVGRNCRLLRHRPRCRGHARPVRGALSVCESRLTNRLARTASMWAEPTWQFDWRWSALPRTGRLGQAHGARSHGRAKTPAYACELEKYPFSSPPKTTGASGGSKPHVPVGGRHLAEQKKRDSETKTGPGKIWFSINSIYRSNSYPLFYCRRFGAYLRDL